jgi:hypothetical protein
MVNSIPLVYICMTMIISIPFSGIYIYEHGDKYSTCIADEYQPVSSSANIVSSLSGTSAAMALVEGS